MPQIYCKACGRYVSGSKGGTEYVPQCEKCQEEVKLVRESEDLEKKLQLVQLENSKIDKEKLKIELEMSLQKMQMEQEFKMLDKELQAKLEITKVEQQSKMNIQRMKLDKVFETEMLKIENQKNTAKYIIDKKTEMLIKIAEIKVSAIERMERSRLEAVREAEKYRNEVILTAITHIRDEEILKLFISKLNILDSSVFVQGSAFESLFQMEQQLENYYELKNEEDSEKSEELKGEDRKEEQAAALYSTDEEDLYS